MLQLTDDNRLGVMIATSVVLHAIVILGLRFSPPDLKKLKDNLPTLDVILVNAKSPSKPDKADALAQANLNRGGNTETNRRMKSALPVPKNSPKETTAKPVAESQQLASKVEQLDKEAVERQQQVVELEHRVQQAMTQLNSTKSIEQTPATTSAAKSKLNTSDLMAQSLEAIRLEAEIAKENDAYQKRPKRTPITGAKAREYRFATYIESWRQKVEKIGNLNYPEAAKAQKLYGSLRMTVAIKSDGSIDYIEVNQSSGHKILDDAAKRIVEMAAPYAEFPADIHRDTDIIEIVRTWTFTREDTLSGQ
jgi:protein TonB